MKAQRTRIRAVAVLFALALFSIAPSLTPKAQESGADRAAAVGEDEPPARKVDEFGRAHGCDHGARLDNFAIELMNDPSAAGYVIVYGPRGETAGSADFRLRMTRDYLVTSRGIDPSRIVTVNGGRYKERGESFAELWIVPPGASAPRPAKHVNDDDSFTGMVAEYPAWDSMAFGGEEDEFGPPVGNAMLAAFVDILRSRPDTRGHIVAFQGADSAPRAWLRASSSVTDALKRSGVKDRFHVVFGGYAEESKLQLWVTGANAPPPATGNMKERTPAEPVHLGSYDSFGLSRDENADRVFEAIKDVLVADKNLNACVFVRLPYVGASEPDEDDREAAGNEVADINPSLLVERWRGKLLENKIENGRLIVQVVPPKDEFSTEGLDVWFVPKGMALPDPFAEPESHTPDEMSAP